MTDTSPPPRLQHVVLMSFPETLSDTEDAELHEMVRSFPREIGTMTECRIGRDLTGERTRGYDYLLHTVFPGADALAAYVVHPAHQVLVRWLDAHDCQRLAFDYRLDEQTDALA